MKHVLKGIWKTLPEFVRDSRGMLAMRAVFLGIFDNDSLAEKQKNARCPPALKKANGSEVLVSDFKELDDIFTYADSFKGISEIERWKIIRSVKLEIQTKPQNSDPFAAEYESWQSSIYKAIADKDYDVSSETSNIYVTEALKNPYPYNSGNILDVAKSLESTSAILKAMNLQAGAAILECGPGWGNNTIQFVQSGFNVTSIDIEKNFIKLIEKRLAQFGKKARLIVGDFLDIQNLCDEKFDAVIFHNSFHHSANHVELIKRVKERLSPEGSFILAFEPISNGFDYPWGLRLDGESVYMIRNNGWLELGFQEDYLIDICKECGLIIDSIVRNSSGAPEIISLKLATDMKSN